MNTAPAAMATGGRAHAVTRRALIGAGGLIASLAIACASSGAPASPGSAKPISGPKEINWSSYQLDTGQDLWDKQFRLAEQQFGVKINNVWEPQAGYWDKRQAEYAAGSNNLDVMINSLGWVISGGLIGMFVDHNELFKADKVDTKQYYQADLLSWSWKGKQWAVPMQSGGEVVLYNKALFDAKGVKYPTKDWTYDDLLDICKRLTDPANNKFAITVGQNGLNYIMGTFLFNYGGKLLNDTKDKALYADDPNSVKGAQYDVDLHTKYKYAPTPEALATLPPKTRTFEQQMVALEINGVFRYASALAQFGPGKIDFAPPPKGPAKQTATVAGDGWSMLTSSKAKDAAWRVLHWLHTKEGMMGPALPALSWPPLVAVANTPQWLDQFKGTKINDATKVWETAGHELLTTPEGAKANMTMNAPVNDALAGKIGLPEALKESARQLNELFAQRPAAWR